MENDRLDFVEGDDDGITIVVISSDDAPETITLNWADTVALLNNLHRLLLIKGSSN